MSDDDAHDGAADVEVDVDGAARFAPGHAQIDISHCQNLIASQQHVAKIATATAHRRAGNRFEIGFAR